MRSGSGEDPVLITTAPESPDDEWNRRRKRYAIMMGSRAVCVLVAALTYQYSMWLALIAIVGGAVLPWTAVIMANDRPPKKRAPAPQFRPGGDQRALPAPREPRIVDG